MTITNVASGARVAILSLVLLVLSACGSEQPPAPAAQDTAAPIVTGDNARAVQSAASNVVDQAQSALNDARDQAQARIDEAVEATSQTAEELQDEKADELKEKLESRAGKLF